MSDARPRRAARDSARREPESSAEPAAVELAPTHNAAPVADQPTEPPPPAIEAPPEPPPGADAPTAALPTQPEFDGGWTVLAEAQAVFARACEQIAQEVDGAARSGIAAGTDAALALLDARTLAEAIEINAGLARRGFDAIVASSARLSEIGVKALGEAARPLFASQPMLFAPAPQLPR